MRGQGEGSVYKRKSDNLWVGTIELPPIAGKRRRRVVARKDKAELIDILDAERIKLAENGGNIPTKGTTVAEWFTYWLKTIKVRPNTHAGYRSVVKNHIIPSIGKIKLDALSADDLRRLELDIKSKDRITGNPKLGKLSSSYANNAHTIVAIALKAAQAERILTGSNIAALMKAPKKSRTKLESLDLDESIKVLGSLTSDPLASLWATYFFTGARRGEVLGLEVDRIGDEIDLSWQMQRIIWQHGCDGGCGFTRGNECPQRHLNLPDDYEYRHIEGGLYWTRPKSSAGWRIIPLVEPLKSILHSYLATTPRNAHGLVWAQPSGWPLDAERITEQWQKVTLPRAGITKRVRIHDIRHSTIDLLYELGVPEDVIMEIVGHSVRSVTRSYKTKASLERLSSAMLKLSELFEPKPVATGEVVAIEPSPS